MCRFESLKVGGLQERGKENFELLFETDHKDELLKEVEMTMEKSLRFLF